MSTIIEAQGACLCGAVKITCKEFKKEIVACHCSMCRKWSGGPFLGIETHSECAIEGKESISIYDSSDWAQRGFCKHCGTHLFYRLKAGNHYSYPAGFFNFDDKVSLSKQIFIDGKPSWYAFSNKTLNMTGQEVFDAYSAKS